MDRAAEPGNLWVAKGQWLSLAAKHAAASSAFAWSAGDKQTLHRPSTFNLTNV